MAPAAAHVPQHLLDELPLRPLRRAPAPERRPAPAAEAPAPAPRAQVPIAQAPIAQAPAAPAAQRNDAVSNVQQSIARIQEACQAPPLAPPEYRLLFELMAKEITDNDLIGAQTITNITQRAQERGLDVRRDDVRFVLEVVSEADPWFEQGASANLFAGRFRNFVVARCRGQGINLSADELDLIDAWFAGGTLPQGMGVAKAAPPAQPAQPQPQPQQVQPPPLQPAAAEARPAGRWWSLDDGRSHALEQRAGTQSADPPHADEFPRIVRTRLRG
jgi:hypothetical protein